MKAVERIIELLEYGTNLLGWAVRSLRSFPIYEKIDKTNPGKNEPNTTSGTTN